MDLLHSFGAGAYVMALTLAALGSALGTGTTGMAAVGAWRKSFLKGKAAPFILVAFASAPLSQTIYGMILMNAIAQAPDTVDPMAKLMTGFWGGLAIGVSAWYQGKAGAMACDALVDTNKGLGNYIMVLGIIETVALFVMVFLMTNLK
ncbi:MAG: V-type ATP synthase subunit K [Candidatus Lambdaproteobacteria bacterium RIFOXYD12_FULL_49_8]|uniref:V-type ATP synthase subunit K n=1 Tax=Candidatus Lambdaproteobacteria bacterium RIFOXYD2_FULL_50_16 TaxID=1817772 RepID=A0A1F6GFK2_9PROT|nr:MAG: V-type ATP synthase subunit K [Candidatus Lambdaproteobacteria bacterium RIFOXYD2_FULL_50_16]OGG97784.1 MAG: V-type ATP synthase subunit K [Candidatus Lambdaproteobacteria bacterium RIFOXYD12_FULL_49_8]